MLLGAYMFNCHSIVLATLLASQGKAARSDTLVVDVKMGLSTLS